MKTVRYILDATGKAVPEPNLFKWADWMEKANRTVAVETVGRSQVSTVFLGLDYSFRERGPILWETMVFGGKLKGTQRRCGGNREQAEAMHADVRAQVRAATKRKVRVK